MIVVPVSDRGRTAVRDALLSHGWEGDVASITTDGLRVSAFRVDQVAAPAIEAMVPLAAKLGLELVTGPDWLLLAGPRARLGAFARPWVQPEAVRELAHAIGVALPPEPSAAWHHATGTLALDRPLVMGIINATPDSFAASSRTTDPAEALALADALRAGGARALDVGGESTRPGAIPISAAVEVERILPVIGALVAEHPDLPISVDTMHAATARAALDAGAVIVNDVTAGRHDPALLDVVHSAKAGVILSHSRGAAGTLAHEDHAAEEADITAVVAAELVTSRDAATARGIGAEHIVLDPGFGFGKSAAQNWRLLDQLDAIVALGHPVLVGVSRKRFLGTATELPVADRDRATAAACALAHDRGARLFRVHDAAAVRDALAVAEALT